MSGDRDKTWPDAAAMELIGLTTVPVEPSEQLRDLVLGSLDRSKRFAGFLRRMAELFDLDEARSGQILAAVDSASEWVAAPFDGVRLYHVAGGAKRAGAHCGLVSMTPEAVFPEHRHQGNEWSLCLQGEAEDDTGRRLLPGDFEYFGPRSTHALRVVSEEPFVFAVVLESGFELV